MKVTSENISGRLVTVIRRPFDADAVRESLAIGVPTVVETVHGGRNVVHKEIELVSVFSDGSSRIQYDCGDTKILAVSVKSIITILPPLPRHPTLEHAGLLYRYASEGVFAVLDYEVATDVVESLVFRGMRIDDVAAPWLGDWGSQWKNAEITHAVDASGDRLDVAIEGE